MNARAARIEPGRYLLLRYREGGRVLPAVDCWGLYRLIVEDATGLRLAQFEGRTESAARAARLVHGELEGNDWLPIAAGDERPLDLVLMTSESEGRLPMHVGCVVRPGTMLDIEPAAGVRLRAYAGPRAQASLVRRVVGLFRPRALAT